MNKDEYYALTTEMAKRAIKRKILKGFYPGCAPVGYKNASVVGRRVIVIDEEKAPLLRLAKAMYQQGISLREILNELTPQGLLSRSGKPMGPSALKYILDNPVYRGWVRYGETLVLGSHIPLFGPPESLKSLSGTERDPGYGTLPKRG